MISRIHHDSPTRKLQTSDGRLIAVSGMIDYYVIMVRHVTPEFLAMLSHGFVEVPRGEDTDRIA